MANESLDRFADLLSALRPEGSHPSTSPPLLSRPETLNPKPPATQDKVPANSSILAGASLGARLVSDY